MEEYQKQILRSIQIALLGEVYINIRSIAIKFNNQGKDLLLRYYLDREPTSFDYDSIGSVATEIEASMPINFFHTFKVECIYRNNTIQKDLDPLDGFVYARREHDLEEM